MNVFQLFLWSAFFLSGQALALTAQELLDRVDDLYRGKSARGRFSMKITTEHWNRTLSMDFWSQGKDYSLVRIVEPKKEKGTATLRSINEIWNFLPKVNRVLKVPSSMMGSSWMGSHFTNDDLVKESRFSEDFTFAVSFEGEKDGKKITEITCSPKPTSAVVWGKVLVVVDSIKRMPEKIFYFHENQTLARTLFFSEVKTFGSRELPTHMKMIPSDKTKEFTEVVYENIEFDIPLKKDIFTMANLQR